MTAKKLWILLAAVALGAPGASRAASQPRTWEIAVTGQGFEPARLEVAADEPLVFSDGLHVASGEAPTRAIAGRAGAGDGLGMAGGMMGGGQGGGMGCCGGMMGGSMPEMSAIHRLLANHQSIQRSVEDVAGGVVTTTTSADPALAGVIREHVAQMKERIETGAPIRQGDPLFREIFANHQHIHMQVEDVPGGVRVKETADDPHVVALVRQHARRAVSEFVAQGMPRAMRPTPLPPGYSPKAGDMNQVSGMGCGCMSGSSAGP